MALKGTVFVILLLIVFPWDCSSDTDFVNPADLLNFDPANIQMTNKVSEHAGEETDLNQEQQNSENSNLLENHPSTDARIVEDVINARVENHCPKNGTDSLKAIFKRFLMSLIQHIESRIDSLDVPVEFCMKMRVSYSDMMLLKLYGTGDTDNVHEVHETLEKMILYPTELPDDSRIYWLEKKIGLSTPMLLMVIATLLLMIIVARMLSSLRITRSLIIKGIVLAFFVSTVTAYFELYQQKVADQDQILARDITERCPHLSQNTLSRLWGYVASTFTFQNEDCKEFYEAAVVQPIFKVSVLEAGAIAITKTFVAPLKILGGGVKEFLVGLLKDLPAQFSTPLFIIVLVLLCVLPFLVCGYTLKIPCVLTLCPPPTAQPSLPPTETKTTCCTNCIKDKKNEVQTLDDKKSTYLTAAATPAIANALSSHDTDNKQISTTSAIESISVSADGDSGKQKENVKLPSENMVRELERNVENLRISPTPILKATDSFMEPEEKREEAGKVKNEKVSNYSPEGATVTKADLASTEYTVSNVACVIDEDTSGSNFFLDQELRPSDRPSENKSNLPPC